MQTILELKNLKVKFGSTEVIRGVNLNIKKGEIHGILGESGSGKTVTAFAIAKLYENCNYSGEIIYKKESILDMNESKLATIRGFEIAYIFQNPHESFNPNVKMGKQLKEALSIHGLQATKDNIIKMLQSVGLKTPEIILNKYPDQLSGGECQRVMIGMSLLCEPQIIIADEPTSSIDASIKKQIIELLRHINKTYGTTIVLISHDIDMVKNICDSMSIMYGGLVMEQGQVKVVVDDPIHPYTSKLIACTDSLNDNNKRLETLEGLPMSPDQYKDRCPFYERCDLKDIDCSKKIPDMIHINNRNYRCIKV